MYTDGYIDIICNREETIRCTNPTACLMLSAALLCSGLTRSRSAIHYVHTNTNNVVIKSQKSTDGALIILVERDFPEIFPPLYMYRYSIDILIPPFLKTNC